MQDEDEEAQNVLVDKKPRHVFPLPGTASAPRMTDSLSRNATGFPSNPRRPALLIYVYELPPSLNVWLAADHAAGGLRRAPACDAPLVQGVVSGVD
eukprot:gene1942-2624_t